MSSPRQSGKILLLQPTVGEWDDMRTSPSLPLALLHAASLTAREFRVEIFDHRLHRRDAREQLAERLTDDVFLVGTTAFTGPMIQSSLDMCSVVRNLRPDLPIVWGGIHASLMPAQTMASRAVDFVVQGEGEIPLRDLSRALAEGRTPAGIPGLWWKEADRIHHVVPGGPVDLDAVPSPPWELVDVERYLPRYKGRRSVYFQSSRGCPLPCTYCYNVVFNDRRWRSLDPSRVVDQIRVLIDRHGVEDVYFVDDMFFTNIKRARTIARGLHGLGITWQVQGVDINGLQRMTDEDYQLIVDAGCNRLTCGIESGSPRIRRYVKKGGTVEDVVEVTARLARFPITLYYSFMCGIPTETIDDVRMTVRLMLELLALNPRVNVSPLYNFTPYPGTELFDTAQDWGFVPPQTLEAWASFGHDKSNIFPERKKFYEALYFTSFFLDDKSREYDVPRLVRWLTWFYRPIARFRTTRLFFRGLVEPRAMRLALALWRTLGQNMLDSKPLHA